MSLIGVVVPYWADVKKDDLTYFSKLAEDLGYHSIWATTPSRWATTPSGLPLHLGYHSI